MRLADLVPLIDEELAGRHVAGFVVDSRKVSEGSVFGAFTGARVNGEQFIDAAVAAGAVAVVARPEAQVSGAAHIADAEPRRRFAELAAQFYRPLPDMLAAVTGTNGKTSVAELTRQLWHMAGHSAASIGTLGVTAGGESLSTGLTSPDIVTFLSNLNGLAREGVTHAIFEASSHGLDQYRCHGVPVSVAAFTNLSRDHLDYHGDLESYFAAKLKLFDEVLAPDGKAVIWTDDSWGLRVNDYLEGRNVERLTVGGSGDFIRLLDREASLLGQRLKIEVAGQEHEVELPLIGSYQGENALISAAIAIASGEPAAKVVGLLSRLQPVRGRLERAAITKKGAVVYVDYAHTPEALAAACGSLFPHKAGRLITVFGAGGDRDQGKRAEMGRMAMARSDLVIVTDDNPRSEDPAAIRIDILEGAPGAMEVADRRDAIATAISLAEEGDVVLLAGKGHEQGQIVGDRVLPFDDVTVAREYAA